MRDTLDGKCSKYQGEPKVTFHWNNINWNVLKSAGDQILEERFLPYCTLVIKKFQTPEKSFYTLIKVSDQIMQHLKVLLSVFTKYFNQIV